MRPTRPAPTPGSRRALSALAAACGALLLLGACSSSPSSDGGSSPEPTDAATGAEVVDVAGCTTAGDVWLVVGAEDGTVLADECVGTPQTGTAALEAAGLEIARDANGLICAIGGEPAACPTTFDGRFWQYYSAVPDGQWQFATTGSDDAVPAPGSIEGWCYGDVCAPPKIAGVTEPDPVG
ncbi:hypothetical protein [Xylanimonas ulmi]|uniref:Lipoprotein n=1 Tax=Xylanimonas ulmi TaxID=228973 RepID=A0A4Q7M112_9MICO|nr:hypothetical protein [Xylanibacterium ulmi]RZS60048.1 hypothetical protein EV386_0289 [Xylanibacterium ulmi]